MASTNVENPKVKSPVLAPTRYDLVSSAMIVIVAALGLTLIFLIMIWLSNRPVAPPAEPPIEWVNNPGGTPDGAPDEQYQLDVPEEVVQEEVNVEETLENVIELSETATQLVPTMMANESADVDPSRVEGTGRGPLGDGPGDGGYGREQRWFVRFADGGTLDEYAKQLEFFNIELGAVLRDKSLVYLTNLTQPQPTKRLAKPNDGVDKRLYMVWRGSSGRRRADEQLFQRAGVDAKGAIIMHFYTAEREAELAKLELAYRNKQPKDILRTYFSVRPDGTGGYMFVVTGQPLRQ